MMNLMVVFGNGVRVLKAVGTFLQRVERSIYYAASEDSFLVQLISHLRDKL